MNISEGANGKRRMAKTMSRIKCPHCGSTNTARIQYGMPVINEKLIADIDAGKICLGGCCISDYDPTRHCNECNNDFGYPPAIFSEEGKITDYYNMCVNSLEFRIGGFFGGYNIVKIIMNKDGALACSHHFPTDYDTKKEVQISHEEWREIIDKLFFKMYLCDWEHEYIDSEVCDGTQWSLSLGLYDGSEKVYSGSNAFPPYMKQLKNLFKKYM